MQLRLIRKPSTETTTIGELFVDGEFFCYTLEDKVRPVKIKSQTAIPSGTYKVIITWSPRFKKQLPLLIGVPNFDGIRIHPGNTHRDTEGCILVGEQVHGESILQSKKAFNKLYDLISKSTDVSITIE